ncbi:MAG: tetratricopeptide repeat protein [Brevinematales bacterium]|nr:tetratricopeptide repeat protein [Brevinematales bacterium]
MSGNKSTLSEEFQIADELFASQHYAAAIEAYRKLLEKPGNNRVLILEKLAWSCYLDGQYKDALRYFQWYDSLCPLDLSTKTMIGICALESGHLALAKTTFLAIEKNPLTPPEALAGLIRTLLRLGEDCMSFLSRWWETPQITPSLTSHIANDLIEKDPSLAETFLDTALQHFPHDPPLSYAMVICCLKQHKNEKAALFCEDLVAHHKEDFPLATLILARQHILSGQTEKAMSLIQEATTKKWLDKEWHILLAEAWHTVHNTEKSQDHLWQAIQEDPQDSSLWSSYLNALSSSASVKEFLFLCQQAYEKTNNPSFFTIGGAFAFSHHEYVLASEYLQKAYSLSQKKEDLLLLIMALFSSNEDQGETILRLASSLSPESTIPPYAAYCIGKSYLAIGKTETAHAWFWEAIKEHPNDPNLLYGLALVEIDRHHWDEAKTYLLRVQTPFQHPNIAYALGLCYLQTREGDKALSFFLTYCETKQDANTCYDLALLLIRNGYKKEALPLLKKALFFNPSHEEAKAYFRLLTTTKESKQ